MAELRGYAPSSNLYSPMRWPSTWGDGFYLTKDSFPRDIYKMSIRPTGPDGSGPFFHSVLTGEDGVTAAVFKNNTKRVVSGSYRYDETYKSGDATIRYKAQIWADGDTFLYYQVYLRDPPGSSWVYVNKRVTFACYSVARQPSIPYRGIVDSYYDKNPLPVEALTPATFDMFYNRLQTLGSFALSSARSGLISPDIGHSTVKWYSSLYGQKPVCDGQFHFDHGELNAFEWWRISGALPGPYREAAGMAYYDAACNLPKSTVNSIANVLEVAEVVAALLRRDFKSLAPSGLKDGWLKYRYQYTTTKGDIAEYAELTSRLAALAATPDVPSDGYFANGPIRAHCILYQSPHSGIPADTAKWLNTYGFELSAVNVWDMIPYSFVVDWFLHISDFLEVCERQDWAYDIPVHNIWTSFRTSYSGQTTYIRLPGAFRAKTPYLDYTAGRSTSGKTIVKRVLDSIALFT